MNVILDVAAQIGKPLEKSFDGLGFVASNRRTK